jgi:hypothetical protein
MQRAHRGDGASQFPARARFKRQPRFAVKGASEDILLDAGRVIRPSLIALTAWNFCWMNSPEFMVCSARLAPGGSRPPSWPPRDRGG